MNRKNIPGILLVLAIIASTFTSCVKGDFDQPPIIVPKANLVANTTIAELLVKYPGACDSIKDTAIISGIVTANDESGNLYKSIVIEDGTAGLAIAINQTSLYVDFRVGQRVYIKCRGMYLGRYHNLPQLGYINGGAIGQLPASYIKDHLFADSLPGPKPTPLLVNQNNLNITMVNKLVRLENVAFASAGTPWAETDASGDRSLEGGPTSFVVRTSNYANFAQNLIPFGTGTIQGILSVYNSTYQLTIRDTSDIIGFKSVTMLFNETFGSSMGGFTAQSVSGDQQWTYDATYKCAKVSGFAASASHANEDWLISPAINLSSASNAVLSFSHAINKGDVANVATNHTVWISKNYTAGAPSTATWEQLTVGTYPPGNNWTFVASGDVAIPASYLGQTNVRIAFKYLCSDTESATWEIQNVKVIE